ncbi:hypothetical protein M0765_009720 [Variovorax sp. S2]|jgi:hypothetical protein|uniref:hypothetical protein n=1 Tax=Variovorax sp. S12S4 TaxID=3029170 RepID=UPI00215D5639|nr:hypothetical protein [Variovorax sp. S12S4]MCR8957991.1 hypothetical protein [Variovorax sp. S12S4]
MASSNFWFLLIPLAALVVVVAGGLGILKLQKAANAKAAGTDRAAHVLRVGLPTTGKVLDSTDTRTRIDRIYILTRLRLHVDAVGGVPDFETELTVPLSPVKMPQFAPGRMVRIKVDPATRDIAIDEPRQ